MKRWMTGTLVFGLSVAALWGVAQAQYRPPAAVKAEASSREDDFDRSVDLKRFRKGTPNWDTQELLASGLTALHREHVRILQELQELKSAVNRLEKEKKQ